MVEPVTNHFSDTNVLDLNGKELVVTKTYAIKWRKDGINLVELANKRWIKKMSYLEIAESTNLTRNQVSWGLRQFKIKHPSSSSKDGAILKEIWLRIEQEKKK